MKIFILTAVILILSSCSARNQAHVLDDVESFISEDPERALSVIDSLSSSGELPGHGDKARFALLYSMALDKNYIDSTDDSLINVAVKWYRRHGSPDEKLKSYYYQGRIYQNAGDKESAMESFVKAEAYVEDAEDDIAAAHPEFIRLLENKGLTEHEIEYCCLYMLGLKGKDIGGYIEKKRHYNDSSEIRKKLGLGEHDTNLGIYLRKILNGNN